MLLYCLTVNVPPETNERALHALPRMIEVYPQLDAGTLWSRHLGKHFAAGMHNPPGTLGRRRYVYESPHHVTFFEGTLVDPRGRLAGSDSGDIDRFWDDIPAVAEGQYVAARASENSVEVI